MSRIQLQQTLHELAIAHDEIVAYKGGQRPSCVRGREASANKQRVAREVEKVRRRNTCPAIRANHSSPDAPTPPKKDREKRGLFTRARRDAPLLLTV